VIKSFKRAISLIVVAVFILSLVPVISFAAEDPYPWTGSNKPKFRGYRATINADGTVTKGTKIEGTSEHYNLVLDHPGNFGKLPSDTVYKEIKGINTAGNEKATASLASGGADFTLSGISDKTKDLVIEFSLCFENESSIFSTLDGAQIFTDWTQSKHTSEGWTGNLNQSFLHITSSQIKFAGTVSKYNFIPGRWYNFTLVNDFENTSDGSHTYNYHAYVNGEKVVNSTYSKKVYGFRTFRMSSLSYDGALWIDNINVYKIDDANNFVCPEAKAPVVSSSNPEITIDSSVDTIVVNKNHKVSDLKAALSIDSQTSAIRYYNADYSAQLQDSDSAVGANVVIATPRDFTISGNTVSQENTFTYFTANKWMYKYPGTNKGKSLWAVNGTASSQQSMSSVNGNLGGKENDDYLMWCDSDGTTKRIIPIDNAAESGKRDVLEMSLYIPSDSNGFSLRAFLSNVENTGAGGFGFHFKNDGIYIKWSDPVPTKFISWEPNKWHSFAMVTPRPYTDGTDPLENTLEVYVDGVKYTADTISTLTGFRYLWPQCLGNGSMTPVAYFDNIRVYNGEYAPQYDVVDNIDYVDGIDKNNIILKKRVTVGELKEGISKNEDTTIRVYENISSSEVLSDGAYVEDGYVVVAAAMNETEMERSYNYYTVDKIPNEVIVTTKVNGDQARLYDADDTLSVSASFNNYTNEDTFTAKMYTAQYKYGELIKVWETESQTVAAGENVTFTCDFVGIEEKENTSIKIMLVNEELEAYCTYETMRYTDSDAKATLYLMGDSVVQTYVDVGYPIQGWGCYLGDYLNDNITVDNRGRSGWTTDHYLYPDGIYTKEDGLYPVGTELLNTDGRKKVVGEADRYRCWDNIKSTLKAGDYIMIALAVNDMGSGNVPVDRYMENVETVYEEATAIGATVILLTPTIRGRDWNSTADFREDYISRGKYFQEVADKHNIVCLPLGAELVKTYNAMVEEYQTKNPDATLVEAKNYVRNYFHLYGASSTTPPPGWDNFGTKTEDDDGHYNFVGVNKVASVIAKLLAESDSPLGDYVEIPQ